MRAKHTRLAGFVRDWQQPPGRQFRRRCNARQFRDQAHCSDEIDAWKFVQVNRDRLASVDEINIRLLDHDQCFPALRFADLT